VLSLLPPSPNMVCFSATTPKPYLFFSPQFIPQFLLHFPLIVCFPLEMQGFAFYFPSALWMRTLVFFFSLVLNRPPIHKYYTLGLFLVQGSPPHVVNACLLTNFPYNAPHLYRSVIFSPRTSLLNLSVNPLMIGFFSQILQSYLVPTCFFL